jgi:hypothetical protein
MQKNHRITQTHEIISGLVFYRREGEPAARERIGLLEQVSSSSLVVATSDRLSPGAMLNLRIYSQAAPPGYSEVSARGVVQRSAEGAKGMVISVLDPGGPDHDRLQTFLHVLSCALRPAPAYASTVPARAEPAPRPPRAWRDAAPQRGAGTAS